MPLCISDLDKTFLRAFENSTLKLTEFRHREHVRLAYIVLTQNDLTAAHQKIRKGLLRLLEQNGVGQTQYHETLTFAWIQAIRHFMFLTDEANSSEDFIAQHQQLLDKDVMFTHYSRERLEQENARKEFVTPDLQVIPSHG